MIRGFAKDAAIYAFPLFLARCIGLILLPIYSRNLGPAGIGFIEFVAATSAILILILSMEINQAVGRLLPDSDSSKRQSQVLSTALWFTIIMFSTFGLAIYANRFELLRMANLSVNYSQYFGLVCASLSVSAVVNLLQVQFRFTGQAKSSVAINLTVVLANFILIIYFFTKDRLGIEQYFFSQVISSLSGILVGLSLLFRKHGNSLWGFDVNVLFELLRYSLPLVTSSIGVALLGVVDRIMIGGYVGLTELGHYGIAARLSAIVGLGFYVVSTAMTPIVYREHERQETKELISQVFNFTIVALLLILSFVTFYADFIIEYIAGDMYYQSSQYLFYLILSSALANLYVFFLGMDITKDTKLLAKINLSAGCFGALGCAALVPMLGVWGAIFSTLSANAARLSAYVYFSHRLYPISIRFHWVIFFTVILLFMNEFVL